MKHYAGELKMVGQGATELRTSGNTYSKVSVIEIGDDDVRGVTMNGYLASQLIPGTPTEIWVQRIAFGKYLMGVKRDGKLRRAGAKPFVFQIMVMIGTLLPLGLLAHRHAGEPDRRGVRAGSSLPHVPTGRGDRRFGQDGVTRMADDRKLHCKVLALEGEKYRRDWRDPKKAARKRRTRRWPPVAVVIAEAKAFLANYEFDALGCEEASERYYAWEELRRCEGFDPWDERDLPAALNEFAILRLLPRTAIAAVKAHLHTVFSEVDYQRPEELRVEMYLPGCPVVRSDEDQDDTGDEPHPRRRSLH